MRASEGLTCRRSGSIPGLHESPQLLNCGHLPGRLKAGKGQTLTTLQEPDGQARCFPKPGSLKPCFPLKSVTQGQGLQEQPPMTQTLSLRQELCPPRPHSHGEGDPGAGLAGPSPSSRGPRGVWWAPDSEQHAKGAGLLDAPSRALGDPSTGRPGGGVHSGVSQQRPAEASHTQTKCEKEEDGAQDNEEGFEPGLGTDGKRTFRC